MRFAFGIATVTTGLVVLAAGCGEELTPAHNGAGSDAEAGGDAGQIATGGSSSGTDGMAGVPSGSSSGDTSGDAGTTGNSGEGGVGGTPEVPCDGACEASTPVCDESSDTCVECLAPEDCVGDEDLCDSTSNTCVECLAPADCDTAAASRCETGACVECEDNNDCAHIAGKGVCDTDSGQCVQCTGQDYESCGMDAGTPLVCDSLARTCTTNKEASAGLCQACVSDAQCTAGKLCVMETFGAQDVGHFCFWKQGDTANGGPALCTSARPYVSAVADQTSIDGAIADICGLRLSTCVARSQFGSKDCATNNAPDDSKCGVAAGEDSKCVADGAGFTCTMTCASDDDRDCPAGIQCDIGVEPGICEL